MEVSRNLFDASLTFIYSSCFAFCTGGRAYSYAYFGAGTGPIYLDDVACTSSASQLLECSSRPILTHNCLHSADAGVGCEGINLLFKCCNSGSALFLLQFHAQQVS